MVELAYITRDLRRGTNANLEHTWTVKCEAIGKETNEDSAYLVANEYIAACLASFLRLPIPAFSILPVKKSKMKMFASYSFAGDTAPADADPEVLYERFPDLCTGVAVFDMWIANWDRWAGNIKVDNAANPKQFWIFDHERSLFSVYPNEGKKRLRDLRSRLGLTGGSVSGDQSHCFMKLLDSTERIQKWLVRIRSVPDWYIQDVCHQLASKSLSKSEARAATSFLIDRSQGLGTLIGQNKNRFPGITKGWDRWLM